jgi:hypothetical protein
VLGVSSVYLCQFSADVAFRRCSTRSRTVLSEMQPNIESGQTLRGSACPHLRALFINLKDSSKQANELLHEPHTASLWDVSKGCVRDLSDHRCRISCSSSNRQRGCEVALHATTEAGKYRSWSCGERRAWLIFLILTVYHTKWR